MEKVESKDGTMLAYDRTGEGPAIILVGGASMTRGSHEPIANLLSKHFTVYNYDRRGRVDSTETLPYAVQREVEDIDALIQAAGGSAFVFGTSSGAVLALQAATRGLSITRLVLWEPPLIMDASHVRSTPEGAETLTRMVAEGHPEDAIEYFATQIVGIPQEYFEQSRNSVWWPQQVALAHTLAYDVLITSDYSVLDRAHQATIPALVMYGGKSFPWMEKTAKTIASVLPNGTVSTLEDQTHGVEAEAIVPVIEAFCLGSTVAS